MCYIVKKKKYNNSDVLCIEVKYTFRFVFIYGINSNRKSLILYIVFELETIELLGIAYTDSFTVVFIFLSMVSTDHIVYTEILI